MEDEQTIKEVPNKKIKRAKKEKKQVTSEAKESVVVHEKVRLDCEFTES